MTNHLTFKEDDISGGIENIAATIIDETPENWRCEDNAEKEEETKEQEDVFNENALLSREISKLSFMSAGSEQSEYKKKLVQMIKPNTLLFSEEDTTYKPPRRKQQPEKGKGGGKTGKFFFGKTLKSVSPEKEKEPIRCVILDVGGERFTAQRNSLLKYPTTRLGKLMRSPNITGWLESKIIRLEIIVSYEGILAYCDEFGEGLQTKIWKFPSNKKNHFHIMVSISVFF